MDIWSLKEYHDELNHELARLKWDAFVNVKVPSIVNLVEMEVPRLNETLLSMRPNEVHIDKDGLMLIKCVTNVFDLRDSASVNVLKYRLAQELKVIKFCFHPALNRVVSFVSIVIQHLERQFQIELYAEKARGFSMSLSSDETEGQSSGSSLQQQPDETVQCNNQEVWIDYAIELKIDANPEDFHGNQLIEALRQVSIDEDIERLVIQKCNEVIQSAKRN